MHKLQFLLQTTCSQSVQSASVESAVWVAVSAAVRFETICSYKRGNELQFKPHSCLQYVCVLASSMKRRPTLHFKLHSFCRIHVNRMAVTNAAMNATLNCTPFSSISVDRLAVSTTVAFRTRVWLQRKGNC